MGMDGSKALRDAAIRALEDAVSAVSAYAFDDDDGEICVDAVLILGSQYIDDDGDRCGRPFMFPRYGSQPPYLTLGLIESARHLLDRAIDLDVDDD